MSRWMKGMQVGFTYIGTIVGAGFATGQEILQFFTQYGRIAVWTITLAVVLFSWLGVKVMLAAHDTGATSYEDLNKSLLGDRLGSWVSLVMLIMLFGVSSVMLAGAGSIFSEQLNFSYQIGLFFTLILSWFVINQGLRGILAVNSIVVPAMFAITFLIVIHTLQLPNKDFYSLPFESSLHKTWAAPFLYTAYNLSLAQAVLVPLGSQIKDRSVLVLGGLIGGAGIGLMLFSGHYVLSTQMPGIVHYEIPMGFVVIPLGFLVQIFFLCILFGQIFTSLIADLYGLSLQIQQRTGWGQKNIVIVLMILCFMVSQLGFSNLLSTLYPLFGALSLFWLMMIILRRRII